MPVTSVVKLSLVLQSAGNFPEGRQLTWGEGEPGSGPFLQGGAKFTLSHCELLQREVSLCQVFLLCLQSLVWRVEERWVSF